MRRTLGLAVLLSTSAAFAAPPASMPATPDASSGWMPLFNGHDLENFYTFRSPEGKNNDTEHVYKIEDGVIHVLDMPDITKTQPQGYLATNNEYRNFRVRLEYKWGVKKYPVPGHTGLPRDSGLLYDIQGEDHVWPQCLEFNFQEHNAGDVWLLNKDPRLNVMTTAATTQPNKAGVFTYSPGGVEVNVPTRPNAQHIIHTDEYESLTDWNKIELVVHNDASVQFVNGHVSLALSHIHMGADGPAITQGRFAIQSQASEMYLRNIEIKPLFAHYDGPQYKVLVFSKTAAFRHASIPNGIAAVKLLGSENKFTVDATEDSAVFTEDNLKQYKAIVFMSTTGDILNDAQHHAMEEYIHHGGGFVGVHAASDTEYHWPWYEKLVGAWFSAHPKGTPTATVHVDDSEDISTSSLPMTWTRADEWYNFKTNPKVNGVHVLVSVDESSYTGGTMSGDHPVTWRHEFEGGRSWYTAMGHTKESYRDPLFLFQLLGGIEYAAGTDGAGK